MIIIVNYLAIVGIIKMCLFEIFMSHTHLKSVTFIKPRKQFNIKYFANVLINWQTNTTIKQHINCKNILRSNKSRDYSLNTIAVFTLFHPFPPYRCTRIVLTKLYLHARVCQYCEILIWINLFWKLLQNICLKYLCAKYMLSRFDGCILRKFYNIL